MSIRTVSGFILMLTMLLMGIWALAFSIQPAVGGTITVPDDYPTIQAAINNANIGDTIYVKAATYYENLNVNKSVELVGENRETTIIDGSNHGSAIWVTVDDVTIFNFKVRNSGRDPRPETPPYLDCGIVLWYTENCNVSGNNVENNLNGIVPYGASNNILKDNAMTNNEYNFGIVGGELSDFMNNVDASNSVDGKPVVYVTNQKDMIINPQTFPNTGFLAVINSTNITIEHLTMESKNFQGILFAYTNNSFVQDVTVTSANFGIDLRTSSNNTISGNNVTANRDGIHIGSSSSNNTISGNNVTANTDDGIYITWSSGNNISGNNIKNNVDSGIWLIASSGSSISTNNITANEDIGIAVETSLGCTIYGNNLENNFNGIWLARASENSIYHNNFVNNTNQVYDYSWEMPVNPPSVNAWDNGYPSGGNYWSDHGGTDNFWGIDQDLKGSDMIEDTAYVIYESNIDNYPLMMPWRECKPCITEFPDLNGDGIVNILDLSTVAIHFGEEFQNP